jgi:hypothetical protein
MAKTTFSDELEQFKSYLQSDANEDAKRPDLYPLFRKLFKDKFKIESDAQGADVYVAGQLIVEAKSKHSQWLEGFYQALHYHKKFGLSYNTIVVVAHEFVGIWKVDKLPEEVVIYQRGTDPNMAPSAAGKHNAKRTANPLSVKIREASMYWLEPKMLKGDIFAGARNLITETHEVLKILKNLDVDRLQINTHNFIQVIERMKPFFDQPLDAAHAFYAIVAYWDITSTVSENEAGDEIMVVGFQGHRHSELVAILPRHVREFKKFVEGQYVFTNEGSGLTVDYYFSRFDEVLAAISPDYVKQHGIFFTNDNLSKFALWYVKEHFPGRIDEDYVVFDPAGGSGNLVSSWRGKLKHKIISELQPDLLRTIERRMRADPWHQDHGFTIVPKTSEGKGLNFLDRPGAEYLAELSREVGLKGIQLDKPLAFLLNPPYKNTDEDEGERTKVEAEYAIDPSILELTGEDAGKERYLAFLGQILNISKEQARLFPGLQPMVMIFTPTSWLIPRTTYKPFRATWDQSFRYHGGFIVTSNEWFKVKGRWPLAFTIWVYDPVEAHRANVVRVLDLSNLVQKELNIPWVAPEEEVRLKMEITLSSTKEVTLDDSRGDIRELLPQLMRDGTLVRQPRVNLYRNRTKEEKGKLYVSGFPRSDDRHTRIKAPHGYIDGTFVGFMDNNTPVRLRQEPCDRLTNAPDRVWFRVDEGFKDINKSKCFAGPPDNRGFCAYDLPSAQATFTWFALTKSLNGQYPLWANQYDLWPPNLRPELARYWHSLCYAFALAENICVVTRFEANNPVEGAPEVFVDNPLCPTNPNSFWSTTLDCEIISTPPHASALVKKIKELYTHWNKQYTKGQHLTNAGLHVEAYFRYFAYPDFLTPHSGLIQIRKYAEIHGRTDLMDLFGEVSVLTKAVREELYRLLVHEFKYFD